MDRAEVTAYLRNVPDLIEAAIEGLSEDDLRRRPSPDGWSILEVACHLRDYAQTEGERIRRLVEEDNPAIEAYDQEARARERDYRGDDPRRALTALRAFWGGLAYQLEGLSDAQWQRGGTHSEWGAITVHSRAEQQVAHAGDHLEQLKAICQAM